MPSEVIIDASASVARDVFGELASRFDQSLPPMLIGAEARDVPHRAQGFSFDLVASSDVDVVVACSGWAEYKSVVAGLQPTGNTGFRYVVAGLPVDILPFGDVESPIGELKPPWPHDGFNVFAMQDVYKNSWLAEFGEDLIARIPSPGGYAALKFKAWIGRSANPDH